MSFRAIYFQNSDTPVAVCIPYSTIEKIERMKENRSKLEIYLKNQKNTIGLTFHNIEVVGLISQLYQLECFSSSPESEDDEEQITVIHPSPRRKSSSKIKIISKIDSIFQKNQDYQHYGKWQDYFRLYGSGCAIVRTNELLQLIQTGIPDALRGNSFCFPLISNPLVSHHILISKR